MHALTPPCFKAFVLALLLGACGVAPVLADDATGIGAVQAQNEASSTNNLDAITQNLQKTLDQTAPPPTHPPEILSPSLTPPAPIVTAATKPKTKKKKEKTTPQKTTALAGQCGTANGTASDKPPLDKNLCAIGKASAVTGNGPWSWSCVGDNQSTEALCVTRLKKDGVCGDAINTPHKDVPTEHLCDVGEISLVLGTGPWTWSCKGLDGGADRGCVAQPLKDDAQDAPTIPPVPSLDHGNLCGTASELTPSEAPDKNLCRTGQAGAVTGEGPWQWTCTDEQGEKSSCATLTQLGNLQALADAQNTDKTAMTSPLTPTPPEAITPPPAPAPKVPVCGASAGQGIATAPKENLCDAGKPSKVGPLKNGAWHWTCQLGKKQKLVCAAPKKKKEKKRNAACGAADQGTFDAVPTLGLCAQGQAQALQGEGPWSWSCTSTDGGNSASCQANRKTAEIPPPREEAPVPHQEESSPPLAASPLIAEGPTPLNGQCGEAGGGSFTELPHDKLCATGETSPISGFGPWSWVCAGQNGGQDMKCAAAYQPSKTDGLCGLAITKEQTTQPKTDLCAQGHATPVKGKGPWTWMCTGNKKGASTNCLAPKALPVPHPTPKRETQTPPPPDPEPQKYVLAPPVIQQIPPVAVMDADPIAPPEPVNGLCGNANGAMFTDAPHEDLCAAGIPTRLAGHGPWGWNCLGEKGGMNVSCAAVLQPPPAVTGLCGASNDVETTTAPSTALCASGITGTVNGTGPWTWTCSGANGGRAATCSAPRPSIVEVPLATVTPKTHSVHVAPLAPPSEAKTLATPHIPEGTLKPFAETAPMLPLTKPVMPTPAMIGTAPFKLDPDMARLAFQVGQEDLDPATAMLLDRLANALQSHEEVHLTLSAYASGNDRSPREARRLSLRRAELVRDYLVEKGVADTQINLRALGMNLPDNGAADRVDITAR